MVGSNHSTLTIRSGDYLADIVTDRVNPGDAFHYVIQEYGNNEVLSWGVEPTIERAMMSSESILTDFGDQPRRAHEIADQSDPTSMILRL